MMLSSESSPNIKEGLVKGKGNDKYRRDVNRNQRNRVSHQNLVG